MRRQTFRVTLCGCFAEDVDLNLGGGGQCGAGERRREGQDNKRKDGNNGIKHWLRKEEESRAAPPRLTLMSINAVICISNLLLSNTSRCCWTFK